MAHAQGGVQASFTPNIDQKLDARPSAQVTSDDENVLASKGYVQIGTISASKVGKKANSKITEQLQSGILQKAAEAGGDVVHLTKVGALDTKEEEGYGRGECTVWSQTTYRNVYGNLDTRFGPCIQWGHTTEMKLMTVSVLVSEGTVWRYAPNWSADIAARAAEATRKAAEADAEQATLIKTIKAAGLPELGADINSAKMKTWMSSLGTPEIDRYSTGNYYNFKSDGVSLLFDDAHKLSAIFLYSEYADGFRQYKSYLPYGLSFQNTRREIERVLGPPEKSGGEGVINYWASYSSKGIQITYDTLRTDDLYARIYHISISAVR